MVDVYFKGDTAAGLDVGFAADKGPREYMEDAGAAAGNVFAVFDGLGGEGDGDVASQTAAKAVIESVAFGCVSLSKLAEEGHKAILRETRGCTAAVYLQIEAAVINVVWSGDVRLYVACQRGGRVTFVPVTIDHRYGRHHLAQCMGRDSYEPDVLQVPRHPGDVFLLCSDGVYEAIDMTTAVLSDTDTAQDIAQAFVNAALRANTRDNAAALVVKEKP